VEGDEAVGPAGEVAPRSADHGGDDEVALEGRADDAPAVPGDAAVLLGEVMLPDDLAVLVVAAEETLRAVDVDVAGLRVAHGAGPAEAVGDDVAVEDVHEVFPNDLARVGVQAHQALALLDPAAGAADEVDSAVHDDGRRAAAVARLDPQHVAAGLLGVEAELLGQAGVVGNAVVE